MALCSRVVVDRDRLMGFETFVCALDSGAADLCQTCSRHEVVFAARDRLHNLHCDCAECKGQRDIAMKALLLKVQQDDDFSEGFDELLSGRGRRT